MTDMVSSFARKTLPLSFSLSICLGMALFGPQAHAETECEQNYRTAPSADDATIHMSFVGLYGADIKAAAAQLKQKGLGEGWELASESSGKNLYAMVFRQKPTAVARGLLPLIQLAKQTDSAIMSVELPKGMSAPTIKSYLCSFLASAGLNGQPSNASRAHADRNFAFVNELLVKHKGGEAAQAGSSPPPAKGVMSVFGLPLGEPFDVPVCKTDNYGSYLGPKQGYCFKPTSSEEIAQPLVPIRSFSGTQGLVYASGERPSVIFPGVGVDAFVDLIDGRLEGVRFKTQGIQSQQQDLETLISKYGKPTSSKTTKLQNGYGATFDNISASWRLKNLTVQFQGVTHWVNHTLNYGNVSIQTDKSVARQKQVAPPVKEKHAL